MSKNKIVAGVLIVGIAVLAWLLLADTDSAEAARERLIARANEYTELRVQGEWPELYKMTDPRDREKMSLGGFLQMYGSDAFKVHEARIEQVDFDPKKTNAKTHVYVDGELDPSKLPPSVRQSFRYNSPEDLRKQSTFVLDWYWRDNEWFFGMDADAMPGVNAEGKSVTPGAAVPQPGMRQPPGPGNPK
jgi:hypothetical protein